MKRTLVTGASGFIGRHVIDRLIERGDEVIALSRSLPTTLPPSDQLRHVRADVRDAERVSEAMRSVDQVIHLAAAVSTRSVALSESINVEGTRVLAAAAAAQPDPPVLVAVSSLAAAGPLPADSGSTRSTPQSARPSMESDVCHPVSHYGRTKLRAEEALQAFADRLPITIVRPPCVIGPGDRNLLALYRTVLTGYNVVLSKTFRYSYIGVIDLVTGILAACEQGKRLDSSRLHPSTGSSPAPGSVNQGIYYITDPQSLTFVELAEMIAASLDENSIPRRRPLRHVQVPRAIGWFVGGFGEAMMRGFGRRVYLNLDKVREGLGGSWVCDGSRAAAELSFRPAVDIATRVGETTADYHRSDWI